jgi:hypothetical protein
MSFLLAAAVDDGGLDGGDDASGAVTGLLESENGLEGLLISDLAEDDVLAIEPAGHDGGDEELRTVGVGTSVGHGQKTGAGVLLLEVLIGELVTVDGATTGTVAAGEVTTLEHEVGDDTVEGRALVTLALLTVAELSEVLSGLGDNVVVQLEVDTAGDGARLRRQLVLDVKEGGGELGHIGG